MGTFGISGALAAAGASGIPFTVIAAIALVLFALFSYKIYKAALYIVGGIGLGVPGYAYLSPMISEAVGIYEWWFNICIAVGCAILGVVIVHALQRLAIFFVGAAIGFLLGGTVSSMLAAITGMDFFMTFPGTVIVPIVSAIVLGIISKMMFKPLFIFGTSIISMVSAAEMITSLIAAEYIFVGTVVGAVLGVLCALYQLQRRK